MSSSNITSAVLLALALGGCAVAPQPVDEPTSTAAAALKNTGVGARYTCRGGFCTCTGDDDCNDMFSDGVCGEGPKSAICHINDADIPRCRCSTARRVNVGSIAIVPTQPLAVP